MLTYYMYAPLKILRLPRHAAQYFAIAVYVRSPTFTTSPFL